MSNPLDDLMRIAETRVQTDNVEAVAETVTEASPTVLQSAAAARALEAAMREYVDILPAIAAAQPLPAQLGVGEQLSGAEWIAKGVREQLATTNVTTVRVEVLADSVTARVTIPAGDSRDDWRPFLVSRLADRGNLGGFAAADDATDPRNIFLTRRDIQGPGIAWRAHGPKAAAFFADRDGQRAIFDTCKLFQTNKATGKRRYPRVEKFDSDPRGGTVELRLPEGMLLSKVQAAEDALRQAFNAPDLVVGNVRVHPVIHLNTHAIKHDFPKVNPLQARWFVRPRNQAERHAAAKDLVLPVGVRPDGSPILVNQDVTPHLAVFADTGAGKTVFLTSIVRAAVLQGSEVILIDAKRGRDFRKLALERLPGTVSYCQGSDAVIHRAVRYARDELERRQALSSRLLQHGFDYHPTPLLLAFDEFPAWVNDRLKSSKPKAVRDAAQETLANMSYIASQAREFRIFLLVAGQFAYRAAWDGELQVNTKTLVLLGPPSEINRQNLFDPGVTQEKIKALGGLINANQKGRGIVADLPEDGPPEITMFQGFFNPPTDPASIAFDAAVRQAPKLRRFAWRFPTEGEGADGAWQGWTPMTDPPSDSLPVVILDGPDGNPVPGLEIFDPTSTSYAPGEPPLSDAHVHANSYDN